MIKLKRCDNARYLNLLPNDIKLYTEPKISVII